MFAFALWDSRPHRLILARARIGVKPLYFAALPETLLFGSEIKALFGHPALRPRLNEDALSLYLTFAATPAPRTLFAGVEKLPPGHLLIVDPDPGHRTRERYWQPLPSPDELAQRRSPEEYVERLEVLVR